MSVLVPCMTACWLGSSTTVHKTYTSCLGLNDAGPRQTVAYPTTGSVKLVWFV
jgi:hypothetical protein